MQQQQQENMRQQQEHMQRQQQELIQRMDTITDQTDTTNSTLTDMSARLERLERASPDLNPVELRTNPSDGNFALHTVPTQVTTPLIAPRPSITSEVRDVIPSFGRPSRAVEGPQLPRSDCHLSVPRKTRLTSDSVTISPVARSREPGFEPKFPTHSYMHTVTHTDLQSDLLLSTIQKSQTEFVSSISKDRRHGVVENDLRLPHIWA